VVTGASIRIQDRRRVGLALQHQLCTSLLVIAQAEMAAARAEGCWLELHPCSRRACCLNSKKLLDRKTVNLCWTRFPILQLAMNQVGIQMQLAMHQVVMVCRNPSHCRLHQSTMCLFC
jgi:hypothetical protein